MRILLDTHILIWFLQRTAELSEETRTLITDERIMVATYVWKASLFLFPANEEKAGWTASNRSASQLSA